MRDYMHFDVQLARRAQAGFTYIGVLIFVAILGLASGTTFVIGAHAQQSAREAELLFVGREFARAFRSYYEAGPGGQRQFPSKLEDLLRDPRYPVVKRHLRKIYFDPFTGQSEWGIVAAPGGGIMGVHSLAQQTPIKVSGFDAEFAQFEGKYKYSDWIFAFVPPVTKPAGRP